MSVSPALRRFLFALAFAFWIGGLTFYGAVVIPIGAGVLGGHLEFGFITQRVSRAINIAAVVALFIFLWNTIALRGPEQRWPKQALLLTWLVMAAAQGGLFVLHPFMDARMEPEHRSLLGPKEFYFLHRIYLSLTTVQVAASLIHLWQVIKTELPHTQQSA